MHCTLKKQFAKIMHVRQGFTRNSEISGNDFFSLEMGDRGKHVYCPVLILFAPFNILGGYISTSTSPCHITPLR